MTFNPSHCEVDGVTYEAHPKTPAEGCNGCHFKSTDWSSACNLCSFWERPDDKNIIWVKAQGEKK